MSEFNQEARTVIDKLGGPAETARLCKVTTGAVSQWLRNGIPPARRMYIELARPEAFVDSSNGKEPSPAS